MAEATEARSLALTPTWSVATVLTIFVAVSLLVERSIHRLSHVSSHLGPISTFAPFYLPKVDTMLLFDSFNDCQTLGTISFVNLADSLRMWKI